MWLAVSVGTDPEALGDSGVLHTERESHLVGGRLKSSEGVRW